MKLLKYLFIALMFSLGATSLTSCSLVEDNVIDPDIIVDWAPMRLFIFAHDAAGKNLLDPENPDNLIDGTTITYNGKTYVTNRCWLETGEMPSRPLTRYLPPTDFGCVVVKDDHGYQLYFGEMDASCEHEEDIVINWANGKTCTIKYHCTDFVVTKKEISRNVWFSVGDKIYKENTIDFVF